MSDAPLSSTSTLQDHARLKSYSGQAVIVVVLYLLFWLPGYIANWLYVTDANRMEKMAGEKLPGASLLRGLLIAAHVLMGLGFLVVIALFAIGMSGVHH